MYSKCWITCGWCTDLPLIQPDVVLVIGDCWEHLFFFSTTEWELFLQVVIISIDLSLSCHNLSDSSTGRKHPYSYRVRNGPPRFFYTHFFKLLKTNNEIFHSLHKRIFVTFDVYRLWQHRRLQSVIDHTFHSWILFTLPLRMFALDSYKSFYIETCFDTCH